MQAQRLSPKYTRALFINVFPPLKMPGKKGINDILNRCYISHFSLQE